MRDPILPVDPLAATAGARADASRRPAGAPWLAKGPGAYARGEAPAIPAPGLVKRVRPTSSFEGFGSFSG